ncbi:CRISPR-associated protein Cas4 [Candidatus Woesearchaeota archaeon]|nr:CRISPR-associated protein Cas4 [Candidatus Woesearchaeota archaeon]
MISVTDLTSYMYCSRKLYFTKVLRIREKPKEKTIKGTIKHQVYDLVGRENKNIILDFTAKESLEELEMRFRRVYYKTLMFCIQRAKSDLEAQKLKMLELYQELWPFFLEEAKEQSSFFFQFAQEKNCYGEQLWLALPKAVSELRIVSENLRLVGVVDKLELEKDFTPVEIKTGKAPKDGVWKDNMVQLGAYMLLLSEHYGKEIKEGFIDYKAINERRKITMNPFLKDEIIALIDRVHILLTQKELPEKTKDEWKCKICGIREECFKEEKPKAL